MYINKTEIRCTGPTCTMSMAVSINVKLVAD